MGRGGGRGFAGQESRQPAGGGGTSYVLHGAPGFAEGAGTVVLRARISIDSIRKDSKAGVAGSNPEPGDEAPGGPAACEPGRGAGYESGRAPLTPGSATSRPIMNVLH